MTTTTPAILVDEAKGSFRQGTIERRDLRPDDVRIEIAYAGICHSDIHQAREEWGSALFPMVPGHEIAGTVTEVGPDVTRYAVGDRVGVGCMVDSCGECEMCRTDHENFCEQKTVWTYNDRFTDGEVTYGGYSRETVVSERFTLPHPRRDRPGRGRAAALRRHHRLHPAQALGRRARHEGRRRRARRARPHGRQARRRDGRRGDGPVADDVQGAGRPGVRRLRLPRDERGLDVDRAEGLLRRHHLHRLARTSRSTATSRSSSRSAPSSTSVSRRTRSRCPSARSSAATGPSPARTSAGSRGPRRCSTSAPSTASGPRSRSSRPTTSTVPTTTSWARRSATATSSTPSTISPAG